MAVSHPALDHIEKVLADAYRKEIDQEENIWRSLPFFAATLALQLAVVVPTTQRFATLQGPMKWVGFGLLGTAGILSLLALVFLVRSIYPARFHYIASEPDLLAYTKGLMEDQAIAPSEEAAKTLETLKLMLASQYSIATQHNRRINNHRQWCRSVAGLVTLASVLTTLLLAAVLFIP